MKEKFAMNKKDLENLKKISAEVPQKSAVNDAWMTCYAMCVAVNSGYLMNEDRVELIQNRLNGCMRVASNAVKVAKAAGKID
jgi:hypothetical protein